MMKLRKILWSNYTDNKLSIEDLVNGFFAQKNLCKGDIAHIAMDSNAESDVIAFYIFYDNREDDDCDY